MNGAPGPVVKRRWRHARPIGLAIALAAALLQPSAHAFGRSSVILDLISQFRAVGLAFAIAATVAACVFRSRLAWVLGLVAVLQAAALLKIWLPARQDRPPAVGRPLRLLVANILFVNQDYKRIQDLIERERPDIVGLIEVSPHHLRNLGEVAREFPVRVEYPRHDSHGLALWSRNPLDGPIELVQTTAEGAPLLKASIVLDGRRVRLYLVHTEMPFVRMRFETGFGELAWLRDEVAASDVPCIVAGDLNSTDSSPHFEDLVRVGKLHDSRQGFGPQPSWPAWSALRLTIDHVLVSKDIIVSRRRLGPAIGSDHFPVIVELELPASGADNSARSVARSAPLP